MNKKKLIQIISKLKTFTLTKDLSPKQIKRIKKIDPHVKLDEIIAYWDLSDLFKAKGILFTNTYMINQFNDKLSFKNIKEVKYSSDSHYIQVMYNDGTSKEKYFIGQFFMPTITEIFDLIIQDKKVQKAPSPKTDKDKKSSEKPTEKRTDTKAESFYNQGRSCKESKDYNSALNFYLQAAQLGHTEAKNEVSEFYYYGLGTEKDPQKAFYWIAEAAKDGDINAQYKTGYYYEHGIGTNKNLGQALEWYKKAADAGQNTAMETYALKLFFGEGIQKDESKAISMMKKPAEEGSIGAIYSVGYMLMKTNDLKNAFQWYLKAAQRGYANGQQAVGYCYQYGKGINQDYTQAFLWYQKAAMQNHETALYCLGMLYKEGNGIEKDLTKAYECFSKASANIYAYYEMANALYNGYGVDKDRFTGLDMLLYAAQKGNVSAKEDLIQIASFNDNQLSKSGLITIYNYAKELGMQNETVAKYMKYLESNAKRPQIIPLAKETGKPHMSAEEYYRRSKREKQNNGMNYEAFQYLRNAVSYGSKNAEKALAIAYLFGDGYIKKDVYTAIYYFEKLKKETDWELADDYLGMCFLETNEYDKALPLLKKQILANHELAKQALTKAVKDKKIVVDDDLKKYL